MPPKKVKKKQIKPLPATSASSSSTSPSEMNTLETTSTSLVSHRSPAPGMNSHNDWDTIRSCIQNWDFQRLHNHCQAYQRTYGHQLDLTCPSCLVEDWDWGVLNYQNEVMKYSQIDHPKFLQYGQYYHNIFERLITMLSSPKVPHYALPLAIQVFTQLQNRQHEVFQWLSHACVQLYLYGKSDLAIKLAMGCKQTDNLFGFLIFCEVWGLSLTIYNPPDYVNIISQPAATQSLIVRVPLIEMIAIAQTIIKQLPNPLKFLRGPAAIQAWLSFSVPTASLENARLTPLTAILDSFSLKSSHAMWMLKELLLVGYDFFERIDLCFHDGGTTRPSDKERYRAQIFYLTSLGLIRSRDPSLVDTWLTLNGWFTFHQRAFALFPDLWKELIRLNNENDKKEKGFNVQVLEPYLPPGELSKFLIITPPQQLAFQVDLGLGLMPEFRTIMLRSGLTGICEELFKYLPVTMIAPTLQQLTKTPTKLTSITKSSSTPKTSSSLSNQPKTLDPKLWWSHIYLSREIHAFARNLWEQNDPEVQDNFDLILYNKVKLDKDVVKRGRTELRRILSRYPHFKLAHCFEVVAKRAAANNSLAIEAMSQKSFKRCHLDLSRPVEQMADRLITMTHQYLTQSATSTVMDDGSNDEDHEEEDVHYFTPSNSSHSTSEINNSLSSLSSLSSHRDLPMEVTPSNHSDDKDLVDDSTLVNHGEHDQQAQREAFMRRRSDPGAI